MTPKILTGSLAGLILAGVAGTAQAGSDLEKALANGATRLSSDEISERFKGKTVTFVSDKTGAKYLVYYGPGNELAGGKMGGDTSNTGFQAVNDRDQMCLGWEGRDLPRMRCMDVVLIDGVVHKFRADGNLSGQIVAFETGKAF
jgi:hypothetical protein